MTAKDITPNGTAAVGPRLPLSVLIRSLNEADRIAKTIRSALPLNCEIVVIDAGSKDATIDIAKSLGATVYVNPWPGFGPQRRFGEEKCANDLVFSLDADEILTADLVAELRRLLTLPAPPRLIVVRKAMIFPNHDRPPPLGFCHEQVLIYDRRIARTNLNPNWDKLDISEPEKPVKLRNPLWHFSYRDWNHVMAKWNYVSQLAADTIEPRSRLELIVRLAGEFPISFLRFYFLRRYFLGGADGFTLAMLTAVGRFLRIAKMLERKDHGWKRSGIKTH